MAVGCHKNAARTAQRSEDDVKITGREILQNLCYSVSGGNQWTYVKPTQSESRCLVKTWYGKMKCNLYYQFIVAEDDYFIITE